MEYQECSDLLRASEVIARAFQPNEFNWYVTNHASLETNIKDFYDRLIQLKKEANAHIVHDGSYSSIAVWIPPEFDTPAFPEPLSPEFREAEDAYADLLKRHLNGRRHWHLTILAKDPLNDTKGSTSKVVKPFLKLSKEKKNPSMLECIDERAKDIYTHYGFNVAEEFTVGGDIKAWYMIYD